MHVARQQDWTVNFNLPRRHLTLERDDVVVRVWFNRAYAVMGAFLELPTGSERIRGGAPAIREILVAPR